MPRSLTGVVPSHRAMTSRFAAKWREGWRSHRRAGSSARPLTGSSPWRASRGDCLPSRGKPPASSRERCAVPCGHTAATIGRCSQSTSSGTSLRHLARRPHRRALVPALGAALDATENGPARARRPDRDQHRPAPPQDPRRRGLRLRRQPHTPRSAPWPRRRGRNRPGAHARWRRTAVRVEEHGRRAAGAPTAGCFQTLSANRSPTRLIPSVLSDTGIRQPPGRQRGDVSMPADLSSGEEVKPNIHCTARALHALVCAQFATLF